MAGGKVSARQKMINMMYLVLTALLALNVSKEIIKAFNLIENSLDNSTMSIVQKNQSVKGALQKEASNNNAAAAAAVKSYEQANSIANNLVAEIEKIKEDLLKLTGGRKVGPEGELVKGGKNELASGDNMEVHANYFVQEQNGKRGKDLQNLINQTRDKLLAVLDAAANDPNLGKNEQTKAFLQNKKKEIASKTSLSAQDGKSSTGSPQTWTSMYLEHSPLGGVFAMLSKVQNDARSLEADIAQALAESVNATDIKFDSVKAIISAPISAVLTNQTYEADILLAAYNSKSDMRVTVNGSPIAVEGGVGKYKVTASSPGEFTYKVGIAVPVPGGGTEMKEAEGKYSVFPPMAAISADELNVLYVGLDNPMSISVAGVDPKNVQVSVSPAGIVQLSKTGKQYLARVPAKTANKVTISVTAKVGDRSVSMGSKEFKIRNVPRPTFKIGPIDFSGPVRLTELKAQTVALADLENFVYESVKYQVVSFKFVYLSKRKGYGEVPVSGARIDGIKGALANLAPGDFVQFSEIRAKGPGGVVPLPGVSGVLK